MQESREGFDEIDMRPGAEGPAEEQFEPDFTGRRNEKMWVRDSLGEFWNDRVFTRVLYRVKAGKEATVYCLEGGAPEGPALIAAKVYRPRIFREMRNDSFYRLGRETRDDEGKTVRDSRTRRAMRRKTRFGRDLMMGSWNMNEYHTLSLLHEAGADVPRPLAHGHNAILMEYLGDETRAAPILHGLHLPAEKAREVFDRLIRNVRLLLANDRIHGDLSAYNVLYWNGRPRIIDLPQAVQASTHPQAFFLLSRDIDRLCDYFARQGLTVNAARIACDLWDRFTGGQL